MAYKEEPARYLHRLLEVVEESGFDPQSCLSRQQLTRDQVADPKFRYTCHQYVEILDEILNQVNIPGLGLEVGRRTSMVDHGILGYAFISSANLRKAFEHFSHYQKILGPLLNVFMLEEGGEGVYISEPVVLMEPRVHQFAVESWVAEATVWQSVLEDPPLKFNAASVVSPEPPWSDLFREALGCDVSFGAQRNEVRFPGEFLDQPFSLAEPSVAELCAHQCDVILQQMDSKPDVVNAVRCVLLNNPGSMPGLDDVARRLFVSSRTLRRRLNNADTSFREIVADVRMKLATEYLVNTVLPTAEIAYLLGYSDVTAFHRSFKKQYETTPAAYRQNTGDSLGYSVTIN